MRASTLKLLELEDGARVRAVDQKAAGWYAGRNPDDPAAAAERVYHVLRLGDTAAAEAAWREGCGARLLHAAEDLPDGSPARMWLRARLDESIQAGEGLSAWEADALPRVQDTLRRGLDRVVPMILAERPDRTPQSRLLVYDAYQRWRDGDLPAARAGLGPTPDIGGIVGRDRTVLAAWLAARAGDRPSADRFLASIQEGDRWMGRSEGPLEALAVEASRIRLTVDLAAELELLSRWDRGSKIGPIRQILSPLDVMLPDLGRLLGRQIGLESMSVGGPIIVIPSSMNELAWFGEQIGSTRSDGLAGDAPLDLLSQIPFKLDDPVPDLTWSWPDDSSRGSWQFDTGIGKHLRVLGWHRWKLATASLFLTDACGLVLGLNTASSTGTDLLSMAVTATLAAFLGGQPQRYTLLYPANNAPRGWLLSALFNDMVVAVEKVPIPPPREDRGTWPRTWPVGSLARPVAKRTPFVIGFARTPLPEIPASPAVRSRRCPWTPSIRKNCGRYSFIFWVPTRSRYSSGGFSSCPTIPRCEVPMPGLLDESPFPWADPLAVTLHCTLTGLHPSGKTAGWLAAQAGLDTTFVNLEQPPAFVWMELLNLGGQQGLTRRLCRPFTTNSPRPPRGGRSLPTFWPTVRRRPILNRGRKTEHLGSLSPPTR